MQSSTSHHSLNSKSDSGQSVWDDNSLERRNLELKRRFQGLQVRRDHLERELKAVKNCLVSLDRQMQKDAAYQQLLISN